MIRAASATAAMLAAAVALAACGGSSPTSRSKQAAVKGGGNGLKLAKCMRTHGVPDFPDPSSNGGGGNSIQQSSNGSTSSITVDGHQLNVSAPAFQNAMQTCQKLQPQGPPISGAQLAKLQKGALKMAECMRSHGVPNFPDPKVSTGPGGRGVGIRIGAKGAGGAGGINPQAPAFQAANKICMPLLGGPKGFPTKKAGS